MFLQLPVAIVFIWYVLTFMPEAANQLWWGIPGSLVLLGISFGLPILFMHDRDSKDPFEERELWGLQARVRCEGLGRAQGCRSGRSRQRSEGSLRQSEESEVGSE